MNHPIFERLFQCIGGIDDSFLEEAETADIAQAKADRRRRLAKFGAYGAAGLAVLGGAAAAYWKLRANRLARSA